MAGDEVDAGRRQADRRQGDRRREERGARRVVTRYDLSLVNTESRFPLPRIVEALRRKGFGTLCFYGPPGTGKTALAEHIAAELQRPLMIRQASDIVSKFVGETEQNMAKMFEEAEAEQAVLLLDEADSFLRSRKLAERNYEVSEVNEMLQGMERYAGIFICTTNLFQDLDEAALRRFTFKIRFHQLLPAQRERMFVAEALGGRLAVQAGSGFTIDAWLPLNPDSKGMLAPTTIFNTAASFLTNTNHQDEIFVVDWSGTGWTMQPAIQSTKSDGMYGLGGVWFRGGVGAISRLRLKRPGARRVVVQRANEGTPPPRVAQQLARTA